MSGQSRPVACTPPPDLPSGPAVIVVGMTSHHRGLLSGPARWFVISSALVVALAVGVGLWLGSRLAGRLTATTAVTERIAAGDLDAPARPSPGPATDHAGPVVNAMADAWRGPGAWSSSS